MSPSSLQPLPCTKPYPLLPGQEPPNCLPYSSLISHIAILHMDCNAVFLKFTSAHISPCLKTFDGYLIPKVHPNPLMWPTNYFTIWAQPPSPTSSPLRLPFHSHILCSSNTKLNTVPGTHRVISCFCTQHCLHPNYLLPPFYFSGKVHRIIQYPAAMVSPQWCFPWLSEL